MQPGQPAGIRVTGEGLVPVKPNIARFHVGVSSFMSDSEQAMRNVNLRSGQLLVALKNAGAAERDLHMSVYTLDPQYATTDTTPPVRVFEGYFVQTTIEVVWRNVDTVYTAIEQALAAGADEFGGLRYDVDRPADIIATARRAAVADARRKALQLAESAGIGMGRPTAIIETSQTATSQNASRPESGAMHMPHAEPGELTVRVTVDVIFSIM